VEENPTPPQIIHAIWKECREYFRRMEWFTPIEQPTEQKPNWVRGLIRSLLGALVGLALRLFGAPVWLRWTGWFLLWFVFLGWFLTDLIEPLARLPRRTKQVGFWLLLLSFAAWIPLAHSQWKQEQSEKLSGDLVSQGQFQATGITVEFGNSGTTVPWTRVAGGRDFQLMYDSGIHLELGDNGIELTTIVRDAEGQAVVRVDKNHWTVSKFPVVTDKNYTKDSLEVLDRRSHVVFQVRILPDRIQLAGEWRDDLGAGIRITKCKDPTSQRTVGCIQSWKDRDNEIRVKNVIEPEFLYPSREHWRECISSSDKP
jgi:hypothetical protein